MFNVYIIIIQKFEYQGMKELQITQTILPLSILQKKKCLSSRPPKNKIKNHEMYTKKGAHLQCMNNYYAKIEYKGMKTVGVINYTNQTPPTHFSWKNV